MSAVDTEADRHRSILGPDVEQARYDRGAQVLSAVDGEGGQRVVAVGLLIIIVAAAALKSG